MIDHLLIGGNGLIGCAVRHALDQRGVNFAYTSRKFEVGLYFDLVSTPVNTLPDAKVVYIVAGMAGFAICQSDRESWLANVDGPIRIARRYSAPGREAFLVYVSSEAVEFCGGTELARQKAQVEAALALHPEFAIVRPGRVTLPNAPEFAQFLIGIGMSRAPGLHRWRSDMARDVMKQGNGQDMPFGGIGGDDLPERPCETGYGATVQEIEMGYLAEPADDTDSRIGEMPMPQGPRGFLPRPPFSIDR